MILRIENHYFAVCHTLSQGVAALFGPNSPFTAHHVQVFIVIVIRIIITIINIIIVIIVIVKWSTESTPHISIPPKHCLILIYQFLLWIDHHLPITV